MIQSLKDKMAKAIHRTISNEYGRGRLVDPIDLSERVVDAVELIYDMAHEDAGIASIPPGLQAQVGQQISAAWDIQRNVPAAETEDDRPHFLAPPKSGQSVTQIPDPSAKARSLIVMPGDAEFNQAKPEDVSAKPGLIKATMKRAPARRASNSPAKQYWSEPDLIETLIANTPETIPFDIKRADGTPFRIVAKRNVVNKQGLGGVVLTYKDERVGDGGNIELIAQAPFSLYDEQIDVEAGLKSIVAQLVGKYRDRSAGMPDPVAVGAPPNLGDYMRQGMAGGNVDMRIDRDDAGKAIIPANSQLYAERSQDEILQSILNSTRRANTSLVPPESQLNRR